MLALDVFDVKERRPVFHAVAEKSITESDRKKMDETIQALIDQAGEHFAAAEQAQRAGDWAAYGRELEALGEVLQQLQTLTEGG